MGDQQGDVRECQPSERLTKEQLKASSLPNEAAHEALRKVLPQGSPLYAIIRSVSRPRQARNISLFALSNGVPVNVSRHAAKVLGYSMSTKRGPEAIKVVGNYGSSMSEYTVSILGGVLYRDMNAFSLFRL